MTDRSQAEAWLRDVFTHSERLDIEVHRERVWGDIWKVHTDDGLHWFKAGHPALRREVPLRRTLERLAPGLVLPMVASNPATGWMVTTDRGPTLATVARDEGPHHVVELAATLAKLQRTVPRHELEALPHPVFAPTQATENLDDALAWFAALPTSHPCHVDAATRARALDAMTTVVDHWHDVDPGIDLTVDHNDLHAGNAYPGPLISDWGDACIGHPFGSLRPLLFHARQEFGDDTAETLRRAYLAEWGDPEALSAALDVALHLAVPQRLMCWHLLDDPDLVAQYAQYVRPLWEDIGGELTQP